MGIFAHCSQALDGIITLLGPSIIALLVYGIKLAMRIEPTLLSATIQIQPCKYIGVEPVM